MRPAIVPLNLIPGSTHRSVLRIMQPKFVYRPVEAISGTAPVQLTVPDHGIETSTWHCWLTKVEGMALLNREPSLHNPHRVLVLDADTLEINRISATGFKPRGGELIFQPPVDLAGAEVEVHIFPGPEAEAARVLTLGDGLTVTDLGTIERIVPADLDLPNTGAWYYLQVRYPDGHVARYWEGDITTGRS